MFELSCFISIFRQKIKYENHRSIFTDGTAGNNKNRTKKEMRFNISLWASRTLKEWGEKASAWNRRTRIGNERKSSKLNSFAYYIFFGLAFLSVISLVVSIFFHSQIAKDFSHIKRCTCGCVCACNSTTFLLLLGDALNMCSKKVLHLLRRVKANSEKGKAVTRKEKSATGKQTPWNRV